METAFKDIISIVSTFNSEIRCHEYLAQTRWGVDTKCPKENCNNSSNNYSIIRNDRGRKRLVFKCSKCRRQFSAKQGTIFQNSNIPTVKWFSAIFFFSTCKKGISSVSLGKQVGVTQKTAWFMLQKLRMLVEGENNAVNLSDYVEADEAYCGARKNRDKRLSARIYEQKIRRIVWNAEGKKEKKSRIEKENKNAEKGKKIPNYNNLFKKMMSSEKFLGGEQFYETLSQRIHKFQPIHYRKNIFGMVERDIVSFELGPNGKYKKVVHKYGRLVLRKVGRHRGEICKANLFPILKDHVSKTAHLMTDEHKSYYNMKAYFSAHSRIKHTRKEGKSVQYVEGCVHTNTIENVWLQFKKMEKGVYTQFAWQYTDRYLAEYVFRFNSRMLKAEEISNKLLESAVTSNASSLKSIYLEDDYFYIAT